MPLHSSYSHPLQLVVTVAKGAVPAREMAEYLHQIDAAGARPYRKMVDITALGAPIVTDTIRDLARIVREREASGPVGPIAIVVGNDTAFRRARQFVVEAGIRRPIQVFREQHEARRWLDAFRAEAGDPVQAAGEAGPRDRVAVS